MDQVTKCRWMEGLESGLFRVELNDLFPKLMMFPGLVLCSICGRVFGRYFLSTVATEMTEIWRRVSTYNSSMSQVGLYRKFITKENVFHHLRALCLNQKSELHFNSQSEAVSSTGSDLTMKNIGFEHFAMNSSEILVADRTELSALVEI